MQERFEFEINEKGRLSAAFNRSHAIEDVIRAGSDLGSCGGRP